MFTGEGFWPKYSYRDKKSEILMSLEQAGVVPDVVQLDLCDVSHQTVRLL